MTDIAITVAFNEARLAGSLAFLRLGTDVARVHIFGNERVPSTDDAPGAAPLVTISLADPPGAVSGGLLILFSGPDALVTNSGEGVWARVVNGDGDIAFDCNVSDMSGTAAVRLPSTTLYAGGVTKLQPSALG